jgi:hypothetical protein
VFARRAHRVAQYLTLYLSSQGWDTTLIGLLVMCQRLIGFIGAPLLGLAADRNKDKLQLICMFCWVLTPIMGLAIMSAARVKWACFTLVLANVLLTSGAGPIMDRTIVKLLVELGRPKSECNASVVYVICLIFCTLRRAHEVVWRDWLGHWRRFDRSGRRL